MKLPALTAREVDRILRRAGFVAVRQKGSHKFYLRESQGVTVPQHSRDLRRGTLRAIIKQAGMSVEEFLSLR